MAPLVWTLVLGVLLCRVLRGFPGRVLPRLGFYLGIPYLCVMSNDTLPKTQTSWWRTEVDYEPSFKWWFALQWQNGYIWTFAVALAFFVGMMFSLEGSQLWFCLVPVGAMAAIILLGFIKYPHDLRDQYYRQS